jgi:hypothetical protein
MGLSSVVGVAWVCSPWAGSVSRRLTRVVQGVKQAIRTKGHYITNGLVSQCLLIGGCNRLEWGGLRCNYCGAETAGGKCLICIRLLPKGKLLIYMYLFPKGKCLICMDLFRRLVNH